MVDFVLLGALFGPGAPDPDLGHSQIRVQGWGHDRGHRNFVTLLLNFWVPQLRITFTYGYTCDMLGNEIAVFAKKLLCSDTPIF